MEHATLLQGLTDQEIVLFQNEYNRSRRDPSLVFILTLFFGMFGVHQFYLGKIGVGIVFFLLFFVFGLSILIALINLFSIIDGVKMYNLERAQEIITQIRSLRDRNE